LNHDQPDQPQTSPADKPRRQRTHRGRKKLCRLYCPVHSEQRMLRCSVKRHLVRNAEGVLFAAPPGRAEAEEWAAGFGVQVLADEWLETLLCPMCAKHRTWHVVDQGEGTFEVKELPANVRQQLGTAAVLIPVTIHRPFQPGES